MGPGGAAQSGRVLTEPPNGFPPCRSIYRYAQPLPRRYNHLAQLQKKRSAIVSCPEGGSVCFAGRCAESADAPTQPCRTHACLAKRCKRLLSAEAVVPLNNSICTGSISVSPTDRRRTETLYVSGDVRGADSEFSWLGPAMAHAHHGLQGQVGAVWLRLV